MPERQVPVLRISREVLTISLTALAAMGSATGNIWLAGVSAIPAVATSLHPLLKDQPEERLELPLPPWWTAGSHSWQAICSALESQLPSIIQRVAERLEQGKVVPTVSVVRQTFTEEIAAHLSSWETSSQDRALIAEYVTPLLLKQFATTIKTVITPLREEAWSEILTKIAATLDAAQQLEMVAPASLETASETSTTLVTSILAQKQRTGAYDVYICYDEADEIDVMEIGVQLRTKGILPWFDEIDVKPGTPRRQQQEQQIERISCAAIFVGQHAIAHWQAVQMYAFLEQFVERNCPVIPVLLASAPQKPKLPPFLSTFAWVDMHKPGAIERLLWGISGERPNQLPH